jgi:hypothetical protein
VPPLPEPDWARTLGIGAARHVRGGLYLDALDLNDRGTAALLEGFRHSGLQSATYQHFVNRFESIEEFPTYWSQRPSRLRATVRRKLAQVSRAGSVIFLCSANAEENERAVQLYEQVYRASWKASEPHPGFIRKLVEALSEAGFVRMGLMLQGDFPVAAQIWLVRDRKATIFKLAYIQTASSSSPGTLLTHWMLSRLISDEQIKEVDFGRGDDPYKRDWCAQVRPRFGLVAGNSQSISGWRTIIREVWPTFIANII